MLRITCHGGKCCGVKHIWGFPFYPNYGNEPPLSLIDEDDPKYFDDEDIGGEDVNTRMLVFQDAAPAEPLWDRMDRYLDYLRSIRPGGIVECILAHQPGDWNQIKLFGPGLIDRGFKVVNEFVNSNSGNTCAIYHLKMEE